MNLSELAEPFTAAEIEWRIGQSGLKGDKVWAKVLAYITNRAIMDRLDAVCGPENWRNEYRHEGAAVLCGLSIRVGTEWVTKWDGAENTDIEAVKGGLSNAMKRAAVQWGIGRYLYDLEEGWAEIVESGGNYVGKNEKKNVPAFRWNPPKLPAWALPSAPKADADGVALITKAQRERLFAIAGERKMPEVALYEVMQRIAKVDSTKKLPADKYDAVCKAVEAYVPAETQPEAGDPRSSVTAQPEPAPSPFGDIAKDTPLDMGDPLQSVRSRILDLLERAKGVIGDASWKAYKGSYEANIEKGEKLTAFEGLEDMIRSSLAAGQKRNAAAKAKQEQVAETLIA